MSAHKTSKTYTQRILKAVIAAVMWRGSHNYYYCYFIFLHMSFQFSCIEHNGKKWNLQQAGLGLQSGEYVS